MNYFLVVALFDVFPLPRRSGFRESFRFAGDLADRGYSVLVFPEGDLTPDGTLQPFQAGIGLLAANLRIPVVPMRIDGAYEVREAQESLQSPGPHPGLYRQAGGISRWDRTRSKSRRNSSSASPLSGKPPQKTCQLEPSQGVRRQLAFPEDSRTYSY